MAASAEPRWPRDFSHGLGNNARQGSGTHCFSLLKQSPSQAELGLNETRGQTFDVGFLHESSCGRGSGSLTQLQLLVGPFRRGS